MKVKYTLKYDGITENGEILPLISPIEVKESDKALSKERGLYDFLPKNFCFTPLIPKYIGDIVNNNKIDKVSDYCGWIEGNPKGSMYPISLKFKKILEKFELSEHRFYDANIIIKGDLLEFSVFHVLPLKYYGETLIDFNHSTFCNYNAGKRLKLDDEHIKASNFGELNEIKKNNNWRGWGFNNAFVKHEFHEIDWIKTYRYGILISEKLKSEIEAAEISGVKITVCPVNFQVYQKEE